MNETILISKSEWQFQERRACSVIDSTERMRGKSNLSHILFGKEQVLSPTLSVQ